MKAAYHHIDTKYSNNYIREQAIEDLGKGRVEGGLSGEGLPNNGVGACECHNEDNHWIRTYLFPGDGVIIMFDIFGSYGYYNDKASTRKTGSRKRRIKEQDNA